MISNYFKVFFILFLFIFSNEVKSKTNENSEFRVSELSNYFSAVVAYGNQENEQALKYFKSSKNLINKHDEYLRQYIFSWVLNQNVTRAIQEIKFSENKKNSNFFESYLLLFLDSITKKNYEKSNLYLNEISNYKNQGRFEQVIYETLRNYLFTFEKKKISPNESNFGNLTLINEAFIRCYLDDPKTIVYFENLVNSSSADYSRYLFFYTSYLVKKNKLIDAKNLLSNVDNLSNSLIILQTKLWIDENKASNFEKIFSCKNETDILGEFFFLISNLYSTQEDFEKSNFYLSISNFLNKKFKFNLSLIAENYFINENFEESKNILKNFDKKDSLYYWYRIKINSKIISKKQNDDQSLKYLEKNFNKINNPSTKILFDMANIYKSFKKYDKAIKLYSEVMQSVDKDESIYADLLYKRGGSYERIGNYEKSDIDLLAALKIIPDNSYILNYLAYSWLERNYKIPKAIEMLELAYELNENDPYIIDSVGWGYYLTEKFEEAEILMRRALELMPNDPIVNDHYGDILWSLNRKIQAKYFWNNVLKLKDADDEIKIRIKTKLLKGPKKINESS